jgi:large subunit ribosomal protein L17
MRHRKHNHLLGVKKQHRKALVSNLCAALIKHGRIETTLAKAKAIRPAVEKMITRAKKAKASDDPIVSLHHRRQCAKHLRDKEAAHQLFNQKVDEFIDRPGGYVRIYKLGEVRLGDSAEMALVELVNGDDEGYPKRRKKKTSKAKVSDATPDAEAQASKQTKQETTPEEASAEDVDDENKSAGENKGDEIDELPEEEASEAMKSEVEKPEASDIEETLGGGNGEDEIAEKDASEPTVAEDDDSPEEDSSDQSEAKAEDEAGDKDKKE